jgi:amino acid transporter
MWSAFKHWLLGPPLATSQAAHERLPKRTALAVFSSDALSSVAYASEEILLVLAVAATATGGASFRYVVPISLAIAGLLWVVAFSYRQTIHAYPSGGGAYIVAKDNLGALAGLTAGAALLVDYVLTVSVSITAGVAAVTSAAQGTEFAWLAGHRVTLGLAAILVMMLVNLRGVRESGAIFAVPTYAFVVGFLAMIAWGFAHYAATGAVAQPAVEEPKFSEGFAHQSLSLFLILSAFANGCTALTGVEAISNGVPAFRPPEARNAGITLLWMAGLLSVMFLGTSTLAYLYGVHPRAEETVISQFARTMFTGPMAWAYYYVQATTAAILVLAANTSFADFPRLASLMGRDRYLPAQFAALGDRLVFSNGIVALAVCSALLVWAFGGDTSRLIPLYAVGVFLAFTLSQAGMVRHWWKSRERGWRHSIAVNGLGAAVTALVLAVFLVTKFVHGAWVVAVLIPLLVLAFQGIHRHYETVTRQLALKGPTPVRRLPQTVVMPVKRVHRGIATALGYALSLSRDVRAVYVEVDPAATEAVKKDWALLETDVPLIVLPSPYRSFVQVMVEYVDRVQAERGDDLLTVLLPEYVPVHWWEQLLHNQSELALRAAFLWRPEIVVASVPFVLRE